MLAVRKDANMDVLVVNGVNLNMLGRREPEVYGTTTLADIEAGLRVAAEAFELEIDFVQSNHEGVLVDRIHAAADDGTKYIIINPGAFTHTSVAIRDALLAVAIPVVEVHISNTHAREAFRHHSYISDIAEGVIAGLGVYGYSMALSYVATKLDERAERDGTC